MRQSFPYFHLWVSALLPANCLGARESAPPGVLAPAYHRLVIPRYIYFMAFGMGKTSGELLISRIIMRYYYNKTDCRERSGCKFEFSNVHINKLAYYSFIFINRIGILTFMEGKEKNETL
jgi:hypothetical protein